MKQMNALCVLPYLFWLAAFVTIPIWISVNASQWDFNVYSRAMHSLQNGHDPYLDGIAIQDRLHQDGALPTDSNISFTYVYTPVTLPLLKLLGYLPGWCAGFYWLLYAAGALAQYWVCIKTGEGNERIFLALFAPAAAFFPSLLQTGTILSGNIAYIVYGAVLLAAYHGWRHNRWTYFYAVVLVASCFKPPYLSLLAIPVLSARHQWLRACIVGAMGVAAFAVQPFLWPGTFHNFLRAVALQFDYNCDFGASPAGIFGMSLSRMHIPFNIASWIFYLLYAVPVFVLLVILSRRYFDGSISRQQWIPLLLCGVILLNPRLIEYDLAPVTMPLALILFRHIVASSHRLWQAAITVSLLTAANFITFSNELESRSAMCFLLTGIFAMGSWRLLYRSREIEALPALENAA